VIAMDVFKPITATKSSTAVLITATRTMIQRWELSSGRHRDHAIDTEADHSFEIQGPVSCSHKAARCTVNIGPRGQLCLVCYPDGLVIRSEELRRYRILAAMDSEIFTDAKFYTASESIILSVDVEGAVVVRVPQCLIAWWYLSSPFILHLMQSRFLHMS
jgi:hypothetical protein